MNTTKAIAKLNKELAKKKDNLTALEAKKAEIETAIRSAKDSIKETEEAIKQEKLDYLDAITSKQGMSVDDLIEMFQNENSSKGDANTTEDVSEEQDADTDDSSEEDDASYGDYN